MQVAETLKGRILNQRYAPGELIPSARSLADEFNVSNITIRKAVDMLTREGLLIPRQGVGTSVTEQTRERVEIRIGGDFREWLDSASGRSPKLTVTVLSRKSLRPPGRVRRRLELTGQAMVRRIERVRSFGDEPVSYLQNYFPEGLLPAFSETEIAEKSFVELFQEKSGIRFTRMEQRVEAQVADIELADILQTDFGAALFFIENAYFAGDPTPVEITHMYYRGDRYVYMADIPLPSH